MIDTVAAIRFLASEFVAGRIPDEELEGAVVRLGEDIDEASPLVRALWADLELLFAERSAGDLDDAALRSEIVKLIAPSIDVGPPRAIRQLTTSAARSITHRIERLVLGPLPAADTQVVAELV